MRHWKDHDGLPLCADTPPPGASAPERLAWRLSSQRTYEWRRRYWRGGRYRLMVTADERQRSADHLRSVRNKHAGSRCVIIGNGPSLRQTEHELLADEITFGLNRIYLAFPAWGFRTTYHVMVNQLVSQQSAHEVAQLGMHCYTTESSVAESRSAGLDATFLRNDRKPGFYGDLNIGVWEGATVTFVALQLAFHMGFDDVILVGVDHSFTSVGRPHETVISMTDDKDHFHPDYFGRGYKWQLPDLRTSEYAYRRATKAYARKGRRIVDATVGGQLDIFPKTDLRTALTSSHGRP